MSENTTARRDGAPAEGAAPSRPRRPWAPRTPILPERAFRFSPRTLGITVALFAIGYLVLAFQMPDYTAVSVPVQPSTMPRWLGVALLVLAALLFFQRRPAEETAEQTAEATAEATGSADPGSADGADSEKSGTEESGDEKPDTEAPQGGEPRLGRLDDPRLEIGLFVAALVAYIALFEPLGFILSTALYLGSMTWYLGYRRHLVNAVVALTLPFVFYAGMTWGLDVTLPSGPLPF